MYIIIYYVFYYIILYLNIYYYILLHYNICYLFYLFYIYISLKYNATDRLLNPHVIHELQLMWIVPEGSSVGSSHWANVTTCSCWFQTDGLAATCSRDPYLLKSDFFQEGIILKCHVKIMLKSCCLIMVINDQYSSSFHVIGKHMKIQYLRSDCGSACLGVASLQNLRCRHLPSSYLCLAPLELKEVFSNLSLT